MEGMLLGAWVVIELRVLALNHGIRLPAFPPESTSETATRQLCDSALEQDLLSPAAVP